MQMIGDLQFLVSLVSIQHTLMMGGTKSHHKRGDCKDIFASASITTPVVQPAADHFTDTFQNDMLPFFTEIHCTFCFKLIEFYEFLFHF
jgi:hypothetical protein